MGFQRSVYYGLLVYLPLNPRSQRDACLETKTPGVVKYAALIICLQLFAFQCSVHLLMVLGSASWHGAQCWSQAPNRWPSPGAMSVDLGRGVYSLLAEIGITSSPNLTSYTTAAIAGADNFNDNNATIRDAFDMIVNVTREVTPSCEPYYSLTTIWFTES